jgi:hypothetical protein
VLRSPVVILYQKRRPYLRQAAILTGAFTVGILTWKALPLSLIPWLGELLSSKATEGLAAIVVAAFTGMVWWSTSKMQQAQTATLDQVKREFDAEHRPWVSVKIDAYAPLEFGEDGTGLVYLLFAFENTGRVPATKLRTAYKLVPPHGDPVSDQHEIAKELLGATIKATEFGTSVFPGPPATQAIPRTIPVETVRTWREWWEKNYPTVQTPSTHIVGCAIYESPLNPGATPYQTGFIRELHAQSTTSEQIRLFAIDPAEGAIPKERLRTSGSILGSGAIT